MTANIPHEMRAAQFDTYDSSDSVRVRVVPTPKPGPHQVLVQVSGASVNKGEFVLMHGGARLLSGNRFPKGLGSDFSGVVAAVGPGVMETEIGRHVWGLIPGMRAVRSRATTGTVADYVVVQHSDLHPAPMSIPLADAAALPVVGPTALRAVRLARIKRGDRVLVRGAAGGVGTALVQLAAAAGGRITGLANANSGGFLRTIGAEETLDYRKIDPADLSDFDVVLDAVGTQMLRYRRLLAREGRMVTVTAEPLARGLATIAASTVFGSRRIRFSQHTPGSSDFADLADAVAGSQLRPVIGQRFALERAPDAYARAARGGLRGKLLIEPFPAPSPAEPGTHTRS